MRKIVITVLFLLIGTLAFSQALWENTRYGMSVEQVQALFPSAITPENPRTHPLLSSIRERLRDTTTMTINASGPTYNFDVEYEFEVSFYFWNNDLSQITLTLLHAWADAPFVFDELSKTLTERYGRPEISSRETTRWEVGWSSGSTIITLRWVDPMEYNGETGLILIYQSL